MSRPKRAEPKPLTIGAVLGDALRAEIQRREYEVKRKAELEEMGFKPIGDVYLTKK